MNKIQLYLKRGGATVVALLLCPMLLYPQKVISSSDKKAPHWTQRVDDILRYNSSYEYKVIESEGPNLQSLKDNRLINFALFMQQTNKIDGVVERNTIGVNINGNIDTKTTHKLTYKTNTDVHEFECVLIDEYWTLIVYPDGTKKYRLLSLFAVSTISNESVNFDSYSLSTHYRPSEGMVRSLVPGWGQIYKGSMAKGLSIIGAEALGIGGIVACYSMKSSYEKFMIEDPRHIEQYSVLADTWTNIGYGCIAFTAAVYIYNLIDAAVSPGARRVIVTPKNTNWSVLPTTFNNDAIGLALTYKF